MQLRRTHVRESPTQRGAVRVTGEIATEGDRNTVRELWFEVPAHCADSIAVSGNPWLAALLALAARVGEPLQLCHPVDALLLAGARTAMEIWRCWYPEMHAVAIEADVTTRNAQNSAGRTAALFSGGVDSFFTALADGASAEEPDAPTIDDLITIWGVDIPIDRAEAFAKARSSLHTAAAELGKGHITVATNLRSALAEYPWELAHSGVLAAVGLVLERGVSRLLIPSTHGYLHLLPGGSHPLIDPLFSTAGTVVLNHGSAFSRAQKLTRIAGSATVRSTLRVCTASDAEFNCGRCPKCHCTMLHLYALGLLDHFRTLPGNGFDLDATRDVDATLWDVRSYLDEVQAQAEAHERLDVANAIARCIQRTEARNRRRRLGRFVATRLRRLLQQIYSTRRGEIRTEGSKEVDSVDSRDKGA